MRTLRAVEGVQRLVGLCPRRFVLVTQYAGPDLDVYLQQTEVLPQQRVSIALQVAKISRAIHSHGLVHNDLKGNNLCVRPTPGGLEVTAIDFGMTFKTGSQLTFTDDPTKHYAPEMCGGGLGESTSATDVYSVGFLWPRCSPTRRGRWRSGSPGVRARTRRPPWAGRAGGGPAGGGAPPSVVRRRWSSSRMASFAVIPSSSCRIHY
ncbi:protein kinase [Penaeus vannamei]|uniref:Protein kinase n=1 Tax=Penaeus vannamei TaxID=6689 RepID=A0A3R7P7T9_PENVA|nr:protein kinase [Penaeus vannamei]